VTYVLLLTSNISVSALLLCYVTCRVLCGTKYLKKIAMMLLSIRMNFFDSLGYENGEVSLDGLLALAANKFCS
jgi:hypothetical protein